LNNCTWSDATVRLELNSAWGLPDNGEWDLYRWYPAPARLAGDRKALGKTVVMALRPFEVVLLEAAPSGQPPSLERRFEPEAVPADFAEASRPVAVSVAQKPSLAVSGQAPASAAGGTLVVTAEMHRGAAPFMVGDVSARFTVQGTVGGREVLCEPTVRGPGYPVSWQAWRMALKPSSMPQPFELRLGARSPPDVELTFKGHFLPPQPSSPLKK
jgi:hypothetical protein